MSPVISHDRYTLQMSQTMYCSVNLTEQLDTNVDLIILKQGTRQTGRDIVSMKT